MQTLVQRSRRNKALSILIIEDDTDHQVLFEHSLAAYGPTLKLFFVASADEALAHLARCQFDQGYLPQMVLMDLYLPQADQGWDLLAKIKELYSNVPVIVLSADHSEAIIKRAYQTGANSFIGKPARLDQWESYFKSLYDYWLDTVTLPPMF